MSWRALLSFCAGALYLVCAHAARAAGPESGMAPIRFCYGDWPPYVVTQGDRADGISVDVLTEAARRIGRTAEFASVPWVRCLEETKRGLRDAAMDGVPRPEFQSGASGYILSYQVFWVRDDSPITGFVDLQQFAGKSVSLIQGWWYVDSVVNNPDFRFSRLPGEQSQILSLQGGRQDLAYGDLVTLATTARALKARVRPLLPPVAEVQVYPLFRPDMPELAASMDKALRGMLEDGTIDRIYRQRIGVTLSELRALVLSRDSSPVLRTMLGR